MLGIDESGHAAPTLRRAEDMQRKGRLAARLGPEQLHDSPAGNAVTPQGQVQR